MSRRGTESAHGIPVSSAPLSFLLSARRCQSIIRTPDATFYMTPPQDDAVQVRQADRDGSREDSEFERPRRHGDEEGLRREDCGREINKEYQRAGATVADVDTPVDRPEDLVAGERRYARTWKRCAEGGTAPVKASRTPGSGEEGLIILPPSKYEARYFITKYAEIIHETPSSTRSQTTPLAQHHDENPGGTNGRHHQL